MDAVQKYESAKRESSGRERKLRVLIEDVQEMSSEMLNSEKKIKQQQETIDQLEKLRDNLVKNAVENTEKVRFHRSFVRVITVTPRRDHCVTTALWQLSEIQIDHFTLLSAAPGQ